MKFVSSTVLWKGRMIYPLKKLLSQGSKKQTSVTMQSIQVICTKFSASSWMISN